MQTLLRKRTLGQFFTENDLWLKNHIFDFVKSTKAKIAFDPFAGNGDLLRMASKIGLKESLGFDIDRSLNWRWNDSLLYIPKVENSIIINNPPYLTNYSANRK